MLGMINDPRAAMEIGTLFGGAANDLRDRCSESHAAEERGERGTREDSLTDELVHIMRVAISRRLDELGTRLRQTGVDASIEFGPTNMPVTEETQYGADIGIRTIIRSRDVVVVKGLLVQCKRMYRRKCPAYPELSGRGEQQAKDMLRITPASFFMLFNSGSQEDLLDMTSMPIGTLCPMDEGQIPPEKRRSIGRSCSYWGRSAGGLWDLGVAVLPAARVLALSAGSASKGRSFPNTADRVLPGCLPLGVFMVDLFASCFVGDVREEVVRLVTPPALRDEPLPVTGVVRPDFAGFAVRHYLKMEITARDG